MSREPIAVGFQERHTRLDRCVAHLLRPVQLAAGRALDRRDLPGDVVASAERSVHSLRDSLQVGLGGAERPADSVLQIIRDQGLLATPGRPQLRLDRDCVEHGVAKPGRPQEGRGVEARVEEELHPVAPGLRSKAAHGEAGSLKSQRRGLADRRVIGISPHRLEGIEAVGLVPSPGRSCGSRPHIRRGPWARPPGRGSGRTARCIDHQAVVHWPSPSERSRLTDSRAWVISVRITGKAAFGSQRSSRSTSSQASSSSTIRDRPLPGGAGDLEHASREQFRNAGIAAGPQLLALHRRRSARASGHETPVRPDRLDRSAGRCRRPPPTTGRTRSNRRAAYDTRRSVRAIVRFLIQKSRIDRARSLRESVPALTWYCCPVNCCVLKMPVKAANSGSKTGWTRRSIDIPRP